MNQPRTEAGRRLLDWVNRQLDWPEAWDVVGLIRAIEDEALASEREMAWHANRSARAAIDAAIADLRGRHVKVDVTETEVRDWENYNYRFIADRPRPECLICQERWPCPDAALADRLEEVTK